MSFVRTFLKSRPWLYSVALTTFFLVRQIRYLVLSFPQPLGLSKFDWLPNRKELVDLLSHSLVTKSGSLHDIDWSADLKFKESISALKTKIFPISFTWPGEVNDIQSLGYQKVKNFASIIPGQPYSFSSYESYLREYVDSSFGVTIKKGGWDCFRHIEILASGSVPIMPDIHACPPWAMAHYPKSAMAQAQKHLNAGALISNEARLMFYKWFVDNLTSEAMAAFILNHVAFSGKRVIFLDTTLDSVPDYLSVMTYVGFKKILGGEAVVAPLGASPLYKDWKGETGHLHGLGFGYTRLLEPALRSSLESRELLEGGLDDWLNSGDLVVVANISRSAGLANQVSQAVKNPDKVLYIWGDDQSPTRREMSWIRNLNGYVAIREFYGRPSKLARWQAVRV